jgi:hypothetical protein
VHNNRHGRWQAAHLYVAARPAARLIASHRSAHALAGRADQQDGRERCRRRGRRWAGCGIPSTSRRATTRHSGHRPGRIGGGSHPCCAWGAARSGCARSTKCRTSPVVGERAVARGEVLAPRLTPTNQRQKSTRDAVGRQPHWTSGRGYVAQRQTSGTDRRSGSCFAGFVVWTVRRSSTRPATVTAAGSRQQRGITTPDTPSHRTTRGSTATSANDPRRDCIGRRIPVHTEEVTGSIPVSPTQVRSPVRDHRTGLLALYSYEVQLLPSLGARDAPGASRSTRS